MGALLLFALIVLNSVLSWLNAERAGRYWTETKVIRGWPRLIVWCGLIMAASGFTWVFLTLIALAALSFNWLSAQAVEAMVSVGYIVIVPLVLSSGTVLWLDSLIAAWRKKNLGNAAIAAWNTYAHFHNVFEAAARSGGAIKSITNFFLGDDNDDREKFVVVLLVLLALAAGILITIAIASRADKQHVADIVSATNVPD